MTEKRITHKNKAHNRLIDRDFNKGNTKRLVKGGITK
jgi:hypothetical protein